MEGTEGRPVWKKWQKPQQQHKVVRGPFLFLLGLTLITGGLVFDARSRPVRGTVRDTVHDGARDPVVQLDTVQLPVVIEQRAPELVAREARSTK
jgi:hypothetical protein